MAATLDLAGEASDIVDALTPFGITQADVAAVTSVSERVGEPAKSALNITAGSRSSANSFCSCQTH